MQQNINIEFRYHTTTCNRINQSRIIQTQQPLYIRETELTNHNKHDFHIHATKLTKYQYN